MTAPRRAELFLLGATIVWGSTFVVTKGLLDAASPLIYTAVRFLLAGVIIGILFGRRIASSFRASLLPGTILGLLLFAGFALQTIGLGITSASKSAFFTGMLVVFTPIVSAAAGEWFRVSRKPLLAGNVLGVLLSATGLYLLTSPQGGGFNAGDGMTLVAAFLFALYIVYLDGVPKSVDAMAVTFIVFLVCAAAAFIGAVSTEAIFIRPGPGFLIAFGYLTLFATVISLGIQNRYQADTTPTRAAVIFSLEPVIAAIFAYAFRGEDLGVWGIAGGGIIFTGLVLSELSEAVPGLDRTVFTSAKQMDRPG